MNLSHTSNQFMNETKLNPNKNIKYHKPPQNDCDSDEEIDKLLEELSENEDKLNDKKKEKKFKLRNRSTSCRFFLSLNDVNYFTKKVNENNKKKNSKEAILQDISILIEGVIFRIRYMGSTQLICESQATNVTQMMQAEEAVLRIKAPEGENQPTTEIDFFISTEKIMILNPNQQEIMMDHSLNTISYIADVGNLLVLMIKRKNVTYNEDETEFSIKSVPKMICHVFESEEAPFIAQTVGQAFQISYQNFLKVKGVRDKLTKNLDYEKCFESKQVIGSKLETLTKLNCQKQVIITKKKGEILGLVIIESGWGSLLPTAVIANIAYQSPAARSGQLNIGDQIFAINNISLVGLPLDTCQHHIKNAKSQKSVRLTIAPSNPVVEVKIKRPDTKYQLGFSVQNGVICSLLRGGIAEKEGVRVGHRIIEINGSSVVAVSHERIVKTLATSVGEIVMKTMPIFIFRLLTGQETPVFI